MTFGIIGYGPFGHTFAAVIARHAQVRVFSRRQLEPADLPRNVHQATMPEVARCDVVILANELKQIAQDCQAIADYVRPDTIVMDVCSVKLRPAEILLAELSGHCQLVATHPLFGPQSIDGTDARGKVLVWHKLEGDQTFWLEEFFSSKLGLDIRKITPDDHDREMAWVHALSFFIGRGLLNVDPPRSEFATNYYQQLRKLHDIEQGHSLELFRTIQLANPYAKSIRERFLHALEAIEDDLEEREQ